MIRLIGSLMFAPITATMGAFTAVSKSLGQAVLPEPDGHPAGLAAAAQAHPEPGDSHGVTSSPADAATAVSARATGRWSDLPVPAAPIVPPPATVEPAPPTPSAVPTPAPSIPAGAAVTGRPDFSEHSPSRDSRTHKETFMDHDLNDDMNKLVRYSIICVDRENETVLQETRDTLVKDRMDSGGFTAWKISEFHDRMSEGSVCAPADWEPPNTPAGVEIKDGKLISLRGDPAKYLRVPFQVVDRYPRERFKYEEKQIKVLQDIKSAMGTKSDLPLGSLGPGDEMHVRRKE